MKRLLTGAAVCAVLATSVSVGAQMIIPGGNSVNMPGPNPGGPGLTPYTTGPSPTYPPTWGSPPMYAPTAPPASAYGNPAAAPPPSYQGQQRARTYRGKMTTTYPGGDNSANELNRQELDRLQAQNYPSPPPWSYAPPPQPYYPMGSYAPPPYYPLGTTGGGAPYRP